MEAWDVTVVVPTHNRQPLLARALESVFIQEGVRLEVVVVDDGSTDDTAELLAGLAARRPELRVVRQDDLGRSGALNLGIAAARAELVSILDDDEVLLPGALAALVEVLRQRPDAVVAGGRFEVLGSDDEPLAVYTPAGLDLVGAVAHCECQFGPGTVVRRSVVDAVGGWDPGYHVVPDLDFWLRCGLVGGYAFTTDIVARSHRPAAPGAGSEPGTEHARELVRLLTSFYARDDLPPEALAVKERAFRTAYFRGAVLCGPGLNGPDERYTAEDLLEPVSLGQESGHDGLPLMANIHERAARLHHEVVRLHGEVATRDDEVRALQAELATHDEAVQRLRQLRRASRSESSAEKSDPPRRRLLSRLRQRFDA